MSTTRRASVGILGRATRVAGRLVHDPSAALLISQFVTAAVAFVVNIMAARVLDPSGRGELALLLQIAYLCSLGLLLGTDRSLVAVYTGAPVRDVTRAMARLLWSPSAACLVAVAAVVALPSTALGSWRTGLLLALLFAIVNAFVRAVRSIAIATERLRQFFAYTIVGEVFRALLLSVFFVAAIDDSATWMIGYLVVGVLPTAAWLIRWSTESGQAGRTPPLGAVALARREGLQLFPSALAHSGMLRLDRFLLAGLASTAALGIYASVSTMTELIAWPLLAYADSRLGRWRESFDDGTIRIRSLLLGAAGYAVAAAVVVAMLCWFLLVPLLGPDYVAAQSLVIPLCAAAAAFGVAQVVVTLLIASRQNGAASATEVVGFVVSIAAYVVLIQWYDAVGAAYGSLLGYCATLLAAGVVLILVSRRR